MNATPTATFDAVDHTSAPTSGSSETAASTASPAASAAGRRAGATLRSSFWPRRRKSAAIPNTFATTATAPKKIASGTAIDDGRSASAAPAARKIESTPSAPASNDPDQSSSADIAARESGEAKNHSSASATASQTESA